MPSELSSLYVFAPVSGRSELAGRLDWRPDAGTFTYAPAWLESRPMRDVIVPGSIYSCSGAAPLVPTRRRSRSGQTLLRTHDVQRADRQYRRSCPHPRPALPQWPVGHGPCVRSGRLWGAKAGKPASPMRWMQLIASTSAARKTSASSGDSR